MKLYLIPSPIADSNINWVSNQLKDAILETNFYLVENEKSARRFIGSLKIKEAIRDLHFFILDKKTSRKEVEGIFKKIPSDLSVGVISEAGCPGIADPGALAVSYAHQHDIEVIPIIGPSSIFLALMSSGLSGQRFVFHGYLPIDKNKKASYLKKMEQNSLRNNETQIFMDTPYRNDQMLEAIIKVCDPETKLSIASNIDHQDQSILTKKIREWTKVKVSLHKKPTIFSIMA